MGDLACVVNTYIINMTMRLIDVEIAVVVSPTRNDGRGIDISQRKCKDRTRIQRILSEGLIVYRVCV